MQEDHCGAEFLDFSQKSRVSLCLKESFIFAGSYIIPLREFVLVEVLEVWVVNNHAFPGAIILSFSFRLLLKIRAIDSDVGEPRIIAVKGFGTAMGPARSTRFAAVTTDVSVAGLCVSPVGDAWLGLLLGLAVFTALG